MRDTTKWLGIFGVTLLAAGALLFIKGFSALPLWITFLLGPLCWYLGFAVMIVWLFYRIFPAEEPTRETTTVVKVAAPCRNTVMGVRQEIPAMGGFIL